MDSKRIGTKEERLVLNPGAGLIVLRKARVKPKSNSVKLETIQVRLTHQEKIKLEPVSLFSEK